MRNSWCCNVWKQRRRISAGLALLATLTAMAPAAQAGIPDWLRSVAGTPLGTYPDETNAVLLFDEHIISVSDSGEIKLVVRRAYKILRPQGRERGRVAVYFDEETRITYLKAWSITAAGLEYEMKEKEFIETQPFYGALYDDTRLKVARIPAAEPGNIVGYEYEQKRRPYILQDVWAFQDEIPVRTARFVLRLPRGWEYQTVWRNYGEVKPRPVSENEWVWELQDIAAIESEPSMPPWRAVAGRLSVTYFPRDAQKHPGKSHDSWNDVGLWYSQLSDARRRESPAIKDKVAELTSGTSNLEEKIQALAAFAQRDIRYVAIEIGIGGYQPHAAQDIFQNRYGDCKDKVTLLHVMLRAIGVDSHYVLLHSSRGAVSPTFPSMTNFNHVILAIRLPKELPVGTLYARMEHPRLGPLLLFDPTDPVTPLGYLPALEQGSHGLLVTEDGGELIKLPLLPPAVNRLFRSGRFQLDSNGVLTGEVKEVRWGTPGISMRAQLLATPRSERVKVLESFLTQFLGGFQLTGARIENLENYSQTLIVTYSFRSEGYGQPAGGLLLFRPRVLGQKTLDLLERKERKHPVEFSTNETHSDIYEFVLPEGYQVDELPLSAETQFPFAEYRSKVEVKGNVLHYTRMYQIKDILIPTDQLNDLKNFHRVVSADERAYAILKRGAP
jgi:hypothetical protein